MCETCSKLWIGKPNRRIWNCSLAFTFNCEHDLPYGKSGGVSAEARWVKHQKPDTY